MKYIEMLSMLDPAISRYIGEMQDSGNREVSTEEAEQSKAAHNMQCLCCKGRKRIKVLLDGETERKWISCPSCFGSGRRLSPSESETRGYRKDKVLSIERISFSMRNMPDHWLRAAMVHATHDEDARIKTVRDISERLIKPVAAKWDMDDRHKLGLSRVVSYNLKLRQSENIVPIRAAELMAISERSWHRHWVDKSNDITSRAFGWIVSANEHMGRRDRGDYKQEAA